MPRYLLDTNALSRLVSGRNPEIGEKVRQHRPDCVLSSISWYELEYGRLRSPDPVRTAIRLSLLRAAFPDVQPFGAQEASRAASVRAYLETLKPNALPIGPYDVLLAGHALELGAVLVTANIREFLRVPGLEVESWQGT